MSKPHQLASQNDEIRRMLGMDVDSETSSKQFAARQLKKQDTVKS